MVHDRQPIIGGGAGTGLSAKCEEEGGIDLIVIYNSGRYRMAGRGSLSGLLAYGNANAIVMEMAKEVLPVVQKTPVLAGVNGTDPFCIFDVFLNELAAAGFSGAQNFPTVGLIDGVFRQNLEETGMSYLQEVELVRLAHEKELLTTPYVFDPQQAEAMARAGADLLGEQHRGLGAVLLVEEGQDFTANLNPNSLEVLADCKLEPSLAHAASGARYQFERLGYFCVDADSTPGKPVFNRTVTLRDSWAKLEQEALAALPRGAAET